METAFTIGFFAMGIFCTAILIIGLEPSKGTMSLPGHRSGLKPNSKTKDSSAQKN